MPRRLPALLETMRPRRARGVRAAALQFCGSRLNRIRQRVSQLATFDRQHRCKRGSIGRVIHVASDNKAAVQSHPLAHDTLDRLRLTASADVVDNSALAAVIVIAEMALQVGVVQSKQPY